MSLNGTPYLAYAYDAANRLSNISRGASVFTFGYDKLSRRALLKFPNGAVTIYAYDPLSRLMSMKTEGRRRFLWFYLKNTIEETNYTYDAADNRLSKNTTAGKEIYTYDSLYRLTEVKRGDTKTEAYTYDAVGNRLGSLTNSGWTYSDRNELLSHSGASFTYDANGNLTQKTENGIVWTYEWNAENQLKRVLRDGVEVARFSYDAMGRRVEKIASGVTKVYTYDNEDILREQGGVNTSNYLHGDGIDEPLTIEDTAGTKLFYHADGLNSIIKTTNRSSKVTSNYRYDSFGNIESGATQGGYAYTGREWEPEIGLYYYRARYYDPRIGRFISEDPIGFGGGINFYVYAGNNPVTNTDPTGLVTCVKSRNTGLTMCVDDASAAVCLRDGWCDLAPPRCLGRSYDDCWRDCFDWYNPHLLHITMGAAGGYSLFGHMYGWAAVGTAAATAEAAGLNTAGTAATCMLHCSLDPKGPTHF